MNFTMFSQRVVPDCSADRPQHATVMRLFSERCAMTTTKHHAVILYEGAADELKSFTVPWLRREHGMSYFYASTINPDAPIYCHMTLIPRLPGDDMANFELQVPHGFIKAILYAGDYKSSGFTAAP